MYKALSLLKLCSINLQVLKLDGNYLSHATLSILEQALSKQIGSSMSLQVLSMRDCGLAETDSQNPFQIKSLFEIMSTFAESLVSIDLSRNQFSTYFIEHLPRVPNLTYFNVQGCFDSQETLLSLIDKLASQ